MKSQFVDRSKLPPAWLRSLVIATLVIGLFFRFVNLDKKFYWYDETLTSLAISGHTQAELVQQVLDRPLIAPESLKKFQQVDPTRGIPETLNTLEVDFPEHPPLYYVLLRIWAQWFGSSIAAVRGFSAVLSLIALPAMFWLCIELFDSVVVGWIAVALIAVSPFYVLYAQEARQYGFWTGLILLSGAALLRAIRRNDLGSWALFTTTVALQLYTYPFSLYLVIGLGIYVVAIEKFRITKTVVAFVASAAIGVLCFVPWLLVIASRYPEVQHRLGWMEASVGPVFLIQKWTVNFLQIFLDVVSYANASRIQLLALVPFVLLLLVLVGYALFFLYRQTPARVWLFVLMLILPVALVLLAQDLTKGGYRSTITRYLTPSYIGIQLAVAHLIAVQIFSAVTASRQKLWQLLLVVLISGGVLSGAISSQQDIWWTKGNFSNDILQSARIVNQSDRPLLLLGNSTKEPDYPLFLSLSHCLDADVRLQRWRVDQVTIPSTVHEFSNVFIYNDSERIATVEKFARQQGYRLERIHQGQEKWLWKLSQ